MNETLFCKFFLQTFSISFFFFFFSLPHDTSIAWNEKISRTLCGQAFFRANLLFQFCSDSRHNKRGTERLHRDRNNFLSRDVVRAAVKEIRLTAKLESEGVHHRVAMTLRATRCCLFLSLSLRCNVSLHLCRSDMHAHVRPTHVCWPAALPRAYAAHHMRARRILCKSSE